MNTLAPALVDCALADVRSLACMPLADFIAHWRILTGEPPAIMLDSRSEMLALLVTSIPAAALHLGAPPASHTAGLPLPS